MVKSNSKLKGSAVEPSGAPALSKSCFHWRERAPLAVLLLLMCVFGLFSATLKNAFINYDDDVYVTDNFHVRPGLTWEGATWAVGSTEAGNWHPLTWFSHMLDCQMYGLRPWGHHLSNALLHTVNCFLLFVFFWKMTGAVGRSLFVTALFGLHPLHVESVAWVAERKDVLSTMFFLLTIITYVRHCKGLSSGKGAGRGPGIGGWYFLSVVLFLLGLMSKPMLVTVPFVLLLIDFWPLGRFRVGEKLDWQVIWEKAPFVLLAGASCAVTFVAQRKGDAVESLMRLSLADRVWNAVVSYSRYLGKLVYPGKLAVFYPHPGRWPTAIVVLSALLLAAITLAALAGRRRYPWLLFGWIWFLGTSAPVIGLVQVGSQSMADRYSYIPLLGIFVAVAWGGWEVARGWRVRALVLSMACTVVISWCVFFTWRQIGYWRNSGTLFNHALAVTKENAVAELHVGNFELINDGDLARAIGHLEESVRIEPNLVEAHSQLGVALYMAHRRAEAVRELEEAIRLKPNYAPAHFNLGVSFEGEGKSDAAIGEFREALRWKADYPEAHNGLGIALGQKGKLDESIREFEIALRMAPDVAGTHCNLGIVLAASGRREEAIQHFNTALRLHPHYQPAEVQLRALNGPVN
jgi:tetratricopeptide (TPR) repeat protein